MRHFFLIPLLIIIISGNYTDSKDSGFKTNPVRNVAKHDQINVQKQEQDFFIISVSGTADKNEALEQVKALQAKGHPAGFLWIPDYSTLSGKELYSVYIGPFNGMDTCIKYLEVYKKTNPKAYAVLAGHGKNRTSILGKYDIRVNDKRQLLILIYSTPEDEEAYAEGGGEDWGWFVNDVSEYFRKNYPNNVMISSVYYGWLTEADRKALVAELGLKGFGYVLINGSKKSFTDHRPPNEVITEICNFFVLDCKNKPGF